MWVGLYLIAIGITWTSFCLLKASIIRKFPDEDVFCVLFCLVGLTLIGITTIAYGINLIIQS